MSFSFKNAQISAFNVSNGRSSFFDIETIQTIQDKNNELFNNIIRVIPYSILDNQTKKYINRFFVLDINNNLYELDKITNIFNFKYAFLSKPKIIIWSLKL